MGNLHIGQFITQYPYSEQFEDDHDYLCSGAERVAENLSEALVEKDCRVSVFTSAASKSFETETQHGINIYRSPSIHTINSTQLAPTLPFDTLTHDIDLVHAHNSTPPGVLAAWLYAQIKDVPFVITHHGGETYESHGSIARRAGLFAYTRFLMEPIFRSANRVVTPSEGYIEESAVLSELDDTPKVIPNGIDTAKYDIGMSKKEAKQELGINPTEFVVLYMGSHRPRKGISVLLDGFLRFAREADNLETKLLLAGSGESSEQIAQAVTAENAENIVTLPGFVPETRKAIYMNAADVFVLPSITPASEVFPLVILEAAAGNTPTIASDFKSIRSVIEPNDAGLLVEPNNKEAIASALMNLASNRKLLRELSVNADRMATNHRWEEIANRYLELYKEVLV